MDAALITFGALLTLYGVLALLAIWLFPTWERSPLFGRWFAWQPQPTRAAQTAFAAFILAIGVNLFASILGTDSVSRASAVALIVVVVGVLVTQYKART